MNTQALTFDPAQPLASIPLPAALTRIAQRAAQYDRVPCFPAADFADLRAAGVLGSAATPAVGDGLISETRLIRSVAKADAATARILDGHLNGTERLRLLLPEPLRFQELARVRSGELLVGVWGADPLPSEGPATRLITSDDSFTLRGVKVFCSGAGGVDRALVVVTDEQDARRLAYIDTTATEQMRIDRSWYRASGLRASESHRVEFDDTPVLALLGTADELTRDPWFSRDAIRSAAVWVGLCDSILAATREAADQRLADDDSRLGLLGQMRVALQTIDLWLTHSTTALNDPDAIAQVTVADGSCVRLAAATRIAISQQARSVADLAGRICGSRTLVTGGPLDRARRDLDLFLLQHRLDPKLTALGVAMLTGTA